MRARVETEVQVAMPTRVGLLASVAQAIGDAGVNIKGVIAYEMEGTGQLMFVTDDPAKAASVARDLGGEVTEEEVAAVEMVDEIGTLADAAQKIADAGINVYYVYGSGGFGNATIYFNTSDAAAAVAAIEG